MENIFIIASRQKLRFNTPQGLLSVEDLWDLPLTSEKANRANLDDLAVSLHRELESGPKVSFVNKSAKADDDNKIKFDIVKHIIDVRLAENEAATLARANREKKQQILSVIARKENEQLEGTSLDELRALAESL